MQVLWTREEDLSQDFYRPCAVHRLRAGLDAGGRVIAWDHRMANPSRYAYAENGQPPVVSELYPDDFPRRVRARLPSGVHPHPVRHPGRRLALHPALVERVRGAELRGRAGPRDGPDPLALRLELLGAPRQLDYKGHGGPVFDTGRLAGVLRLAADKAGWGSTAARRGGPAASPAISPSAATRRTWWRSRARPDGFRVERVVAAVDCGRVVNRSGAEAQVQGGVLDGISAALYGGVTVEAGRVRETNFDRYRLTRMREAPRVETWFVSSEAPPSGLGEPPVPPVAPALASAVFALTGERPRRLPLDHVAQLDPLHPAVLAPAL